MLGIGHIDILFNLFAAFYFVCLEDSLGSRIFDTDFRSAKRPSCSGIHINLDTRTFSFRLCMFKHFHPAGRKKLNFIRVIPLHPIDRSNFYCSHSGACVFFQIIRQVLFVYGTSQPPPSGTGTCFHRSVRPLLCLHYSTCGEQAKNYQLSFIHYSFGVL